MRSYQGALGERVAFDEFYRGAVCRRIGIQGKINAFESSFRDAQEFRPKREDLHDGRFFSRNANKIHRWLDGRNELRNHWVTSRCVRASAAVKAAPLARSRTPASNAKAGS